MPIAHLDAKALRRLADSAAPIASVGVIVDGDRIYALTGTGVTLLRDGSAIAMTKDMSDRTNFSGVAVARAAWILEHWLSQFPANDATLELEEGTLTLSVPAAGSSYTFEVQGNV